MRVFFKMYVCVCVHSQGIYLTRTRIVISRITMQVNSHLTSLYVTVICLFIYFSHSIILHDFFLNEFLAVGLNFSSSYLLISTR